MNPPLGLRLRHTLHPVRARLKFKVSVYILPSDATDDFLIPPVLARPLIQHFDFPAFTLGKPRIHTKQIAGKNGSFITAGSCPNFQKNVVGIVGVAW